ncbi:MAG: ParB N-terminal domain-containing protein [Defluviitaleaceae bacterium]|nr:ParB N-terminal domain-containing protein [Defluviitaleaceae bacterium]
MNPQRIPLHLTRPHPADPFKPYSDEKLAELAAGIAGYGLFNPILVNEEKDGTYTILSGKNRTNACRLNGQTEIDAFVYDVDEDTARMMITDSNLKNRDRLLPSERGFAYRMQLEAMKRQGKRYDLTEESGETEGSDGLAGGLNITGDDLYDTEGGDRVTCALVGHKFNRSRHMVAAHHKVGAETIRRYIRLTYLIPELLDEVDNEHLSLYAGVDLSYLDEPSQHLVYTQLILDSPTPLDITKSAKIKQLFKQHGTFTEDTLAPLRFQSRGTTERVVPLINRKHLASLTTEVPLPEDDEELIRMFAAFLVNVFKAHGTLAVLRETREAYY